MIGSSPLELLIVGAIFLAVIVPRLMRQTVFSSRVAVKTLVAMALIVCVGSIALLKVTMQQSNMIAPAAPVAPTVESFDSVPPTPLAALRGREAIEDAADDHSPIDLRRLALPEWTRQPLLVDGSRKLVVVKSGPWASVEEAESHAFEQAASTAVAEFRHLDPRGLGTPLDLSHGEIRQTALKQRFDEVSERDFGKFKAPMHQIWLQVDLTP